MFHVGRHFQQKSEKDKIFERDLLYVVSLGSEIIRLLLVGIILEKRNIKLFSNCPM